MKRIDPIVWTKEDRELWARIASHDFEAETSSLTFADRVARDHGWPLPQTRAAIDEYRRFCFLAMRAGCEVTPSEHVDEIWHQHLTYSRDYWQIWCRRVLGRDLHHGPTTGGAAEARRFAGQYAETLTAYEAWFGPPPPDFWPGTAERFGRQRFHVVDRRTHIVIRRPRVPLGHRRCFALSLGLGVLLAIGYAQPASASSLDVLDWTALPFLTFYAVAAGLSIAAASVFPSRIMKRQLRSGGRSRFSSAELGFLAGGPARAADVLILEDIVAGRIVPEVKIGRLGPLSSRTDILVVGGQVAQRRWLADEKSDEVANLRRGLVEDGLIRSVDDRQAFRRIVLLIMGPVFLLGVCKVAVGLERGKPVGVLIFALVATAIVTVLLGESRSLVSDAGRTFVANHEIEHGRALRAPRPDEVIGAFAIMGASALTGTALEIYGRILASEGGGGCGGDAGGCGGGGCGGGGG